MHRESFLPPRERVAAEIVEGFRRPGRPPLVVVTGPPGDLAAALDAVCARHLATGGPLKVVNLSLAVAGPNFHPTDHFPPLAALRDQPDTLVVVKDVHRLHPDALPGLAAVLGQLTTTTSATCVCTVALPLPRRVRSAFADTFARLRADGLVRHLNLRPLTSREIDALITAEMGALPEPALVARLWASTSGWPAAVDTVLKSYQDTDVMRVVDRHAYLTGHLATPVRGDDELVVSIRRLGAAVFGAAKAISVLSPLGAAARRLTGEALGVSEEEAVELLVQLEEAGVLQGCRTKSEWRFRLPVVALALRAQLGPYERCRLAELAVTALWRGEARCDDPYYLPDQLLHAGRMVDPDRARDELLASAGRAALRAGDLAIPWLRAAAELTTDRAERAQILLTHARTSVVRGNADLGVSSSNTVLRSYVDEIPPGELLDVCFLHMAALYEAREIEALDRIARAESWPWPGTRLERAVARAFALSLLGRWQDAHDLVELVRGDPGAELVESAVRVFSPITDLWLGVTDEFEREIATLPARVAAGDTPLVELFRHTGALLVLGEPDRAERLLSDIRRLPIQLPLPNRMMVAAYRGDVDTALELARRCIATSSPNGSDAYQTVMFQLAVLLQLSRGNLGRGRELLAVAQARQPVLPHVLALPEARYDLLFGETGRARATVETALRQAEEDGVVAQTDALWVCLADIATETGQADPVPDYLQRVEKVAGNIGSESAEVNRLTLHAFVHSDHSAAEAALGLVRRRRQPLEQAVVIERLVHYGVADPALLSEAYALYGDLDALMARATTRYYMREHGVAVPGRQATVAENERLLAVLVADGLGNKQIATVLRTSEKSVEGRLSRLFSRTGYQSRVELATAVLAGRFTT